MPKTDKPLNERIFDFLYCLVGFEKVREIMQQDHPGSAKNQSLLEGTIIGTFALTNTDDRFSPEPEYDWVSRFRVCPHIYTAEELDEQQESKWYLRGLQRRGGYDEMAHIPSEIKTRAFFLAVSLALRGFTQSEIQDQWIPQIRRFFPETNMPFVSNRSSWESCLRHPDIYVYTGGQRTKRDNKVFLAAFNLKEETVERLNNIGRSYNHHTRLIEDLRKYHSEKERH